MTSFSAGAVISRSMSLWGRNFVPFTILMLLVNAPLLAYLALAPDLIGTPEEPNTSIAMLTYLQKGIDLLATGAVVYVVFQQLRGQPASIGTALSVGASRFFPVLGVSLLLVLCIGGALVPMSLFLGILMAALGTGVVETAVYLMAIPIVVVAAVIYCMLWVAVPVAVVEQPGAVAALRRSRELTAGNRSSIFGILLLLYFLVTVVALVFRLALAQTAAGPRIILIGTQAITAVFGGLLAVAVAVGYHDLRQAKEGVGIEELAKVFE